MELQKNQTLLLENARKLTLDSVINVESFNDDYLELNTNYGAVTVEGKNLKIEELIQENGKIIVTGEIKGFYYREEKHQKSIFSIFK